MDEIKTLSKHFPEMSLEDLIEWACLNGALALNLSDRLGSLEKGKMPGINLITSIDFKNMALTAESTVKKLV